MQTSGNSTIAATVRSERDPQRDGIGDRVRDSDSESDLESHRFQKLLQLVKQLSEWKTSTLAKMGAGKRSSIT